MIQSPIELVEINHAHLYCGLGGGAKGFNRGKASVGSMRARFRCLGGIDVSPAAIRDFERLSGVPGTVLDLMDREQYFAFHGQEPPAGWREAMPEDIRRAFRHKHPHILFLSAPCKGFSGLLSESRSQSGRYQALNRLTLRGIWLALEAYRDDPFELLLFENVPRIATRGRHLLDQIGALLRHYGYAVAETTHDCGELGGLAQSRKRFLLVARHREKVPPFLYQPQKRPLRAVGDVLGRMPLPGAAVAGPMHRMPALQWRTWVRLAFVEAGSDWRSLSKLRVEDGILADYGIVPDREWRSSPLGVLPWDQPSGTVTGRNSSTNGRFSVADPRVSGVRHNNVFRVARFHETSPTVTGGGGPSAGGLAVADPRCALGHEYGQYGVLSWSESMGAVSGQSAPGGGRYAVADPRQQGPVYGKYAVVAYDAPAGTVIGGSTTGQGAYAVADPRAHNYGVLPWSSPSGAVVARARCDNGRFSIADPRTPWNTAGKDTYRTQANFGVLPWNGPAGAVTGHGQHDNGAWSVADPRGGRICGLVSPSRPPHFDPSEDTDDSSESSWDKLPAPADRLVAVIRAIDGTWHRPFTTLELAALQGLVDPEEHLELDGLSDQAWRERIGNAVPPPAAAAIAGVMGTTLLLAWSGETFSMSSTPVWVAPVAAALAVETMEVAS
jgi:site-specific DNA-cytosine methylase